MNRTFSPEEANDLRAIFDELPDAVVWLYPIFEQSQIVDFEIKYINSAGVKYVGASMNEPLGKRLLRDAIPNRDAAVIAFERSKNVMEIGETAETSYRLETGQYLDTSRRKFKDGILVITHDRQFIRDAQVTLERSATRLEAVFNSSQSGMFIFAPVKHEGEVVDFRFVITNPTFASYVNVTPDVLDGELGSKWFPGYLTNGVFDMYKRTYLTGETQRHNFHYNVDQHDLYLDLMSTKLGDEVLVTFNDFTPLKKAQDALELSLKELKASNANLDEFASVASHDLKEPIRKIRFFTERLADSLEGRLDVKERDYLNRLNATTNRMAELVDDLLAYSQAGVKTEKLTEVDLNIVVDVVMKDFDFQLEQSNVDVKIDIGRRCRVHGDFHQLQQVFHNIIGNAIKYSKAKNDLEIKIFSQKAEGISVGVTTKAEEQYCCVSIQDNGIGFDQEYAERIFNVFTRLHGNSEYTGSGIGLSIVRKVMENHNGFVTAIGKFGEGATFNLYFPSIQQLASQSYRQLL